MSGDKIVEKGAEKLERLGRREDADFLRKLKPSLMKARAKGEAPTDQVPGTPPAAPSAPQLGKRPKPPGAKSGPSPFAVVGGALALGIALAKLIDWRGHAHPRD